MTVHWGSLISVFVVALCSTVAVVVLVTVAMLGLSTRSTRAAALCEPTRHPAFSPAAGTAVAAVCLAAAALIVLVGLWAIVANH